MDINTEEVTLLCIIHQWREFSFKFASSTLSVTFLYSLQSSHTLLIILNKTNVSVPMNSQYHQFVQLNDFLSDHKVRMEKENSWRFGAFPGICCGRKWNRLLRILARNWMKWRTMDTKLNLQGCTFKSKSIHRQEDGESGSGVFYEVM